MTPVLHIKEFVAAAPAGRRRLNGALAKMEQTP